MSTSKVALVTGSSRGIGAAVALALSRAGWAVCINYIERADKAEELAAQIRSEGGVCITQQADVADREAVFRMVRRIEEELGPVELLVSNAGVARQQQFQDITPEFWQRLYAVNVNGGFHCAQAVLPHMLHEHRGCMIFVSSIWGQHGASCEAAYASTKHAIIGLSRSLSAELALSGIRVNCVAPGVIDTDMVQVLGQDTLAELAREIPLGRLGRPEEIAQTVLHLAENPYITGQVITVDGGFVI
jgi:3-oxoacyl-[acyl-carrier protein] reductase